MAPEESASRQEVNKFVRWFGRERSFSGLTAAEIDNFAEHLSRSDTDYLRKLELVRTFLTYAKKKGWSKINLAAHLKARGKTKSATSVRKVAVEAISLTQQGYAELEAEIEGSDVIIHIEPEYKAKHSEADDAVGL